MTPDASPDSPKPLQGHRVCFLGTMNELPKYQSCRLARQLGAVVVDEFDDGVDIVVLGLDADTSSPEDLLRAFAEDRVEMFAETEFWQKYAPPEGADEAGRLYTPAMTADLLGVPVSLVRHWIRNGWLEPICTVNLLAYFDFDRINAARLLAELHKAGATLAQVRRQIEHLQRRLPDIEQPLLQLPLVVEGRRLLVRHEEHLIQTDGQLRLDFDAAEEATDEPDTLPAELPPPTVPLYLPLQGESSGPQSAELIELAARLEEQGRLAEAADMYRTALVVGGPDAELCFLLAEILYRLGDVSAARERYYMAVELNEDYVEARANLGCVLAELGHLDLAVAALQGALRFHDDYPDAHYHLALLLDQQGNPQEAEEHWRSFLRLAPESPWAEEARDRLEQAE